MPSAVALIPARAGSQRVPGKNIAASSPGHPLIAYSIAAARASGLFDAVSSRPTARRSRAIAERYGAEVPALRARPRWPTSTSPDIEWVRHTLAELASSGRDSSSSRSCARRARSAAAATIRRAWDAAARARGRRRLDPRRRPCREHPGKMWRDRGRADAPPARPAGGRPDALAPVRRRCPRSTSRTRQPRDRLDARSSPSTARSPGERSSPFLTEGCEGFSIDYPDD